MNEKAVSMTREQLSALADGELVGDDVARLLAMPERADDLQSTWHAYHVIGDVLRGGEQAASPGASGFLARLQNRLQFEQSLVAVRPSLPDPLESAPDSVRIHAEPANDASFRWKMVAGCASFAAVVAMAWGVAGNVGMPGAQPQFASASPSLQEGAAAAPVAVAASQTVEQPVTLVNGEAQVMIRDARLDELLTAHKQAGGGTALQMPAGFLRSATFAAPQR